MRPEDVTPAERILRHLRQRPADVRRLLIGGNEPTLHPDFEGALRAARRLGYTRVELMTSGTTLAAGASAWRHLGLAEVVVPLYSADRAVHDAVCGVRCFDRVIAGLDAADGAGVKVSPHTVALPETLDGLDALAQLCQDRWGARLAVGLLREKPVFDWAARAPRLDAVREALAKTGHGPLPLVAPRCLSAAWTAERAEEDEASLLARLYFMTQRREHPPVCEGCALKPRCPGVVAAYAGEAEALRPVWRRA
ncbi:radical SAM protein [Myxococcota bacterium]|nr:radical SAM protein [Myxococcota bacterium]